MTTIEQARAVLAEWLAARSAAPAGTWTADALRGWDVTEVDEWLAFAPPGYANRMLLVSGRTVFSFAPSQLAPPDALIAARAAAETDRPEPDRPEPDRPEPGRPEPGRPAADRAGAARDTTAGAGGDPPVAAAEERTS